ncbi:hypothetical protein AB205_0216280, partial [Aquarana catesbeiana]
VQQPNISQSPGGDEDTLGKAISELKEKEASLDKEMAQLQADYSAWHNHQRPVFRVWLGLGRLKRTPGFSISTLLPIVDFMKKRDFQASLHW